VPAIATQPQTALPPPAPGPALTRRQRIRRWLEPKAPPTSHREWFYRPLVAWLTLPVWLGVSIAGGLELVLVLQVVLGLLTYDDRRSRRLPWFWWPTGVVNLGPICYLVYCYRRPEHLRQRDMPAQPVISWQYVQAGPGYAPAAWYFDPWRQARLRYWDGARWTPYISY
jgi:hypothetical protein